MCRVGEREGFRDYAGRVALIEGERDLESKRDAWIAETSESVLLCRALQTRARSSPSAFLSKLVLAMVPCSSRTSPEREAGRRGAEGVRERRGGGGARKRVFRLKHYCCGDKLVWHIHGQYFSSVFR